MTNFIQTEIDEKELEVEYSSLQNNYSDRELLEIFPEAKSYLCQKIGFLKMKTRNKEFEVLKLLGKVYSQTENESFNRYFWLEVVKVLHCEEIDDLKKEARKLSFLLNPPKEVKGETTPAMIQKAKEFPFENLIQFNRTGFAKCFAHAEKTPSLHLQKKKNKIHCFGCQKNWDAISYLMETKGLDFKQAVLTLQ